MLDEENLIRTLELLLYESMPGSSIAFVVLSNSPVDKRIACHTGGLRPFGDGGLFQPEVPHSKNPH